METFEFIVFILVLASCTWLGLTAIWQRKEISELKERVRNEKKPMSNVWLSSLSNNLPIIFDNQHGKEIKGKKYPEDFEDFAKKMSFKLSDLKPTERDVALAIQKQFFDLHKDDLNGCINALKEKNKLQSTEFEEKEKMYVEKIRQLEKILADEEIKVSAYGQVTNLKADSLKNIINDTEKKRTEAYELINNVYMFKDTVLLDYGRYRAEEIDLSEFEKELEITFKNYCRQEKIIKEKSK